MTAFEFYVCWDANGSRHTKGFNVGVDAALFEDALRQAGLVNVTSKPARAGTVAELDERKAA